MQTEALPAEVHLVVREHVAHIRLDRPRVHNALSPEMIRQLTDIWKRFMEDRACRVAIVSGTGASFCSGMDLRRTNPGFGWKNPEDAPPGYEEAGAGERRSLNYIPPADCYKPIIGAAHGATMGGGLELYLSCDIRYAAQGTRFAFPEVKRGLLPSSGATFWLSRICGYGRTIDLLSTGREIDAEEGLRLGLVDRVLPQQELYSSAEGLAAAVAANAPLAVQAVKEAVRRSLGLGLQDSLNISENLSRILRYTEDYREGALAFAEKRAPKFEGR
ncbi:enoyl-CoA hydratase/isomerase family protein [Bradyrhizobium sp. dw_78]|uniref:enoyl-CoA hydratase/isomerase family protein n=1 Tax=Bradyrhizobium sp. dw_78 TaxID=2719793 RepID=UPI001BD1E3BE|nr:enoyl-CoA hydratase/isomerase family protein [Bradyrhizobium sp. dw_78]